jgi:hypothetical protein
VIEHAVGRARHRVHADQQRGVASLLEELGVLRPLLLHDEVAARVELVGNQRVEGPALAGAVAVHDDDLRRTARERPPHRRVDLLGVEPRSLGMERLATRDIGPIW